MGFIEDLQKYQKGNKKQYNMADLNALVDQVNDQLLCDDGCQRQKEINKLKKKYDKEKNRLENAPHDLDNSRKSYFTYAFGEEYYDEFMKNKAKKEITKLCNMLTLDHQHSYKNLTNNINDYESIKKNNEYMVELFEKYKKENKQLQNNINEQVNSNNINSRRVVYEVNEVDKLDSYNNQLLFFYWLIVLCFLITFFFKNMYKEPRNFIVVFAMLVYPFIVYWFVNVLYTFISFIYNLLPKNMYLNNLDN